MADELWIPHSADLNDPRSRLSARARRRIARAQLEADNIRTAAVSTSKSLTGAKKKFELNQADYRAAHHLLSVVFTEFQRAGFSTSELLAGMKDEVQAAASSVDLYLSQEHTLNREFFILSHADPSEEQPALNALSAEQLHEQRKAKVRAWCLEHKMRLEVFAADVLQVGRRTFYRWWRDPARVPHARESIERTVDKL